MELESVTLRRLGGVVLLAMLPTLAAAQGMKIPRPTPGLMPNPATGKPLFETHCGSCHGVDLRGTDKGPPLLHRIY
ncbi:MAG: c-type cytochrome, partial [Proteobacteria bacterium]|nr:c-type cytochrome [Pseudomonadota bacterium]